MEHEDKLNLFPTPYKVRLLLMNGAHVDMETFKEQQSPMHYSAKYNSLDSLKLLMNYSGKITSRDYKGRTPLYLAAEKGSAETALFLLDLGAPVGVYDVNGNSALTCLLEKVPDVAYRAIAQYQTTDAALGESYMYLSHLETDTTNKGGKVEQFAKTPLEIITMFHDTTLIMHPVIQKSIEVKWNLFGKKDTLKRLLITLLYLACWIVLSYTYSDNGEYYYTKTQPKDWSVHTWKIVFEVLIIVFALYFFLMEFFIKKESVKQHRRWVEWKQHLVKAQYVFCHPAWPGERESLEAESERMRSIPTLAGKEKFWFVYEFVILLLLLTSVVLRVVAMIFDTNMRLYKAAKVFFTINMIFSFVRMLKICIRFRYFSVFLKMAGLAVSSFIQIGFLYLQFYIPFVAVFWLMFGGDAGVAMVRAQNVTLLPEDHSKKTSIDFFLSLNSIFYIIYESSFGQESIYRFVKIDKTLAQILISFYHIFSTFIALSIFVAFVTSKFTTNYELCVAEASLLQASIVLEVEKALSKKDQIKVARHYAKYCSPHVSNLKSQSETIRNRETFAKLELTQRRIANIESSLRGCEDRYKECKKNNEDEMFGAMYACNEAVADAQDRLAVTVLKDLDDVAQKQNYMNKKLAKLLKEN